MTSKKQKDASKKNIKKAQEKWKKLSSKAKSRRQPKGKDRKKPGTTGKGDYYHITVRPKYEFSSFRVHDIGREGDTQRVAGRRKSGSWATHKWLISKKDAHIENGKFIFDDPKVKKIRVNSIRGKIEHIKGDLWKAKPRKNVPEKEKPTKEQKKARMKNIKKAQKARKKK